MRKELEISVPTTWAGINLKKYLELQAALENYKDDEEAQVAAMIYHICGIDPKLLQKISAESFVEIKKALEGFLDEPKIDLIKTIKINTIEYGFEPNLSQMSYGAYVDITKYNTISIDENWANIMSILYRPIERKQGDNYTIKPYDGKLNPDLWLSVGMDVHFSCLFFFVNLLKDLLNSTLKSTIAKTELPANYKQTLEKSGEVMQRLLNLPITTLER